MKKKFENLEKAVKRDKPITIKDNSHFGCFLLIIFILQIFLLAIIPGGKIVDFSESQKWFPFVYGPLIILCTLSSFFILINCIKTYKKIEKVSMLKIIISIFLIPFAFVLAFFSTNPQKDLLERMFHPIIVSGIKRAILVSFYLIMIGAIFINFVCIFISLYRLVFL